MAASPEERIAELEARLAQYQDGDKLPQRPPGREDRVGALEARVDRMHNENQAQIDHLRGQNHELREDLLELTEQMRGGFAESRHAHDATDKAIGEISARVLSLSGGVERLIAIFRLPGRTVWAMLVFVLGAIVLAAGQTIWDKITALLGLK